MILLSNDLGLPCAFELGYENFIFYLYSVLVSPKRSYEDPRGDFCSTDLFFVKVRGALDSHFETSNSNIKVSERRFQMIHDLDVLRMARRSQEDPKAQFAQSTETLQSREMSAR